MEKGRGCVREREGWVGEKGRGCVREGRLGRGEDV